jgi:vacuolar-type H+-ATPase catalytic subunit A/Vma1
MKDTLLSQSEGIDDEVVVKTNCVPKEEKLSRRHSQVVRQKIANLLFPSSNPGVACCVGSFVSGIRVHRL